MKGAGPCRLSPISSIFATYAHEVVTRNKNKVEILRWRLDTSAPRAPQVGQNAGGVHLAVGLDLLQGDVAGDEHARSAHAGGAVHKRGHFAVRLLLRLPLGLLYRLRRGKTEFNNSSEAGSEAAEGTPPLTIKTYMHERDDAVGRLGHAVVGPAVVPKVSNNTALLALRWGERL